MPKASQKEIESAKALLKANGYQTDNLWSVPDVKAKFNCTDKEALGILYKALTNEATMEQIWLAIDVEAEEQGFEQHPKN